MKERNAGVVSLQKPELAKLRIMVKMGETSHRALLTKLVDGEWKKFATKMGKDRPDVLKVLMEIEGLHEESE